MTTPASPAPSEATRAFAAKYPGWCRACGASFAKGEPVRYDDEDEVVHAFGCPAPPSVDGRLQWS